MRKLLINGERDTFNIVTSRSTEKLVMCKFCDCLNAVNFDDWNEENEEVTMSRPLVNGKLYTTCE